MVVKFYGDVLTPLADREAKHLGALKEIASRRLHRSDRCAISAKSGDKHSEEVGTAQRK
jgi:hypothetical protein